MEGQVTFLSRGLAASLMLAVCALAACGYARNTNGEVTAADWQILYDNPAEPETAAKAGGWRAAAIPSKFKLPYKPKRDYQYVWLKASFDVKTDHTEYYGIHLGRVYYLDRVYVNGRLIGEHDAGDPVSMHFPRNYELPDNALSKGKNTLLVRLGVYGSKYGGITDPVLLLKKESFKKIRGYDEFIFHHAPLAIAVAVSGQIAFFLVFFAWSRRTDMLLVILYYSLAFLLLVSDMFGTWLFGHDLRLTFKDAMLTAIPAVSIFMIQSFYRVYIPIFNACLGAFLAVALAATFANFDTTSPYYFAEAISNGTMLLALPAGIFTLAYSQALRPDRTKLFVVAGLILLPMVFVLRDVIGHYFLNGFAEYTGVAFMLIYMVAIVSLLARNIIRREIKLRVLYNDLRTRAAIPLKRPVPGRDERIDAVIEFIRNNFMSDLSRDGLASTVGVSADYLSKKFNAATGRRIDEYISGLRVEAAAEQLLTTDRKVIDIAFSVGFDSMSTFNRIFLKQKGTSPKYYRDKNREVSA